MYKIIIANIFNFKILISCTHSLTSASTLIHNQPTTGSIITFIDTDSDMASTTKSLRGRQVFEGNCHL